tara:strand:+ start:486 stop:629 length:144 start_codon:yes stop_codon:yes gene_type:complete
METYVAATLGCLTAMAIVAYAKELKWRWDHRYPLFGKDKYDNYDDHW